MLFKWTFARHWRCLRPRSYLLIPLIVIILIGLGIFVTLSHYRRLYRETLLSETWKKIDSIKSNVESMEQANHDVKQGIELLREKVNLLKERFKRANQSSGGF